MNRNRFAPFHQLVQKKLAELEARLEKPDKPRYLTQKMHADLVRRSKKMLAGLEAEVLPFYQVESGDREGAIAAAKLPKPHKLLKMLVEDHSIFQEQEQLRRETREGQKILFEHAESLFKLVFEKSRAHLGLQEFVFKGEGVQARRLRAVVTWLAKHRYLLGALFHDNFHPHTQPPMGEGS